MHTKRIGSLLLALALVLGVSVAAGAEAPAITAQEVVDQLIAPRAAASEDASFTKAELQEILAQAEARGFRLSPGWQRVFRRVDSYDKAHLGLVFAREALGPFMDSWDVEDQYWLHAFYVKAGSSAYNDRSLPREGEKSQQEIEAIAVQYLEQQAGRPLHLQDPERYRISRSLTDMPVNPYRRERGWTLTFSPFNYDDPNFSIDLETDGSVQDWMGNLDRQEERQGMERLYPIVEEYLSRYGGEGRRFLDFSQEQWQALRQALLPYEQDNLEEDSQYGFILRQHYGPAPEGSLTREQAVAKAVEAVAEKYSLPREDLAEGPESYLSPDPYVYAVLLDGGRGYRWKVSFGRDYLVELDAMSGEVVLTDAYSPGNSWHRPYVLDELLPEDQRAYTPPQPTPTPTPAPEQPELPYPQPDASLNLPDIYWTTLQKLKFSDRMRYYPWDASIGEYGYDSRFWPLDVQALSFYVYERPHEPGAPIKGIPLADDISVEEAVQAARAALPEATRQVYRQEFLDSLVPAVSYYYHKPEEGRRCYVVTFLQLHREDEESLAEIMVDAYSGQLIRDPAVPLKEGEYNRPPMGKDGRPLIWGDKRIPQYYWEMMEQRQDSFEGVVQMTREAEQQAQPDLLLTALQELWLYAHNPHSEELSLAGLPAPGDIPQEKAVELAFAAFREAVGHMYEDRVFERVVPVVGFTFNSLSAGSRTWRVEFYDPGQPGYVTLANVHLDAATGEVLELMDQPGNG